MRAELRHLLDKLKAEKEGFQSLIIFSNGCAHAMFRWGTMQFESLDHLERWAYPPAAPENNLEGGS